jgi:hypothetical protein
MLCSELKHKVTASGIRNERVHPSWRMAVVEDLLERLRFEGTLDKLREEVVLVVVCTIHPCSLPLPVMNARNTLAWRACALCALNIPFKVERVQLLEPLAHKRRHGRVPATQCSAGAVATLRTTCAQVRAGGRFRAYPTYPAASLLITSFTRKAGDPSASLSFTAAVHVSNLQQPGTLPQERNSESQLLMFAGVKIRGANQIGHHGYRATLGQIL